MLKGVSDTKDEVRDYIHRYRAWRRAEVEKVFNKGAAGKAMAHEVRTLADVAGVKAQEGRALLALPDAVDVLTEDEMHNLVAIVEELEQGVAEVAAAVDADTLFAAQTKQRKDEITQRFTLGHGAADLLRARFRGDRRAESPANPGGGKDKK